MPSLLDYLALLPNAIVAEVTLLTGSQKKACLFWPLYAIIATSTFNGGELGSTGIGVFMGSC